ncbi:ATP-binding protein [Candidatus Parcubacteria bacterium]|nr:ATP-binding protein [Candidatus Parcubacteria bacterium]
MEKEEILKILEDWNFWKKELETGVKRSSYLEKLNRLLLNEQIIVITGARRSGKSFIMRQLAKDLMKKGVDKTQILMINFEDPRFTRLNVSLLQKIYETYLEFLSPQGRPYIFLDEIQEVAKWEKWVLTMQELKKAQIILSGSNAKLLSREFSSLLSGRHLDLIVSPLSFREFLEFKNLKIKDKLDIVSHEIKIKSFLQDYWENGSFPEAVLKENKKEILLTYFNDLLEKDLIKRYKIRKGEKLKEVVKFYFSNNSSLITFNSLEKSLGISADTIEKFSGYLENIYLIFFVKRFSFKVKEQEKSPRKVYGIDSGLVNTVGFKFSQNLGRTAENIVFLKFLREKDQNPDLEIFYWKDKQHREVDFLLKEGKTIKSIYQTCWDLTDPKTKNREVKSLLKAMKELKLKEGFILNKDFAGEAEERGMKIIYLPLWKFLLS